MVNVVGSNNSVAPVPDTTKDADAQNKDTGFAKKIQSLSDAAGNCVSEDPQKSPAVRLPPLEDAGSPDGQPVQLRDISDSNSSADPPGSTPNRPFQNAQEGGAGTESSSPEPSEQGGKVVGALKLLAHSPDSRGSPTDSAPNDSGGTGKRKSFKSGAKKVLLQSAMVKTTQKRVELLYGTQGNRTEVQPELSWYSRKFVIGIENPYRLYWDLSQVVVLAYIAIVVPLRVAFEVDTWGLAFWIEVLVDVYFYIDIILNFFQVVKLENNLDVTFLEDLPDIAKHYVRGWLLPDVLACLPLDYVKRSQEGTLGCSFKLSGCGDNSAGSSGALKLLKLLRTFRLLKLMRLSRVVRILDRYRDRLVYMQHFLTIVKVFGVTMLASHWIGCAYGTVYDWDAHAGDSDMDTSSLTEKWVICFYWATQTVTTVGYGDTSATTQAGQMVSVLAMTIGGVIFSWFMSNIFEILNPDPVKEKHNEQMQYVVTYLRSNHLPIDTAARVLAFFRKTSVFQFDESKLLSALPFTLRQELFETLYGHIIRCIPIFAEQGDHFINELCLSVTPRDYAEKEIVFLADTTGDDMFIVIDAEVAIFTTLNPHYVLKNMLTNESVFGEFSVATYTTKGAYFGEGVALGWSKRSEYAVVKQEGKLLTLKAATFTQLLSIYPAVRHELLVAFVTRLKKFASDERQNEAMIGMELEHLLLVADGVYKGLRPDFKRELEETRKARDQLGPVSIPALRPHTSPVPGPVSEVPPIPTPGTQPSSNTAADTGSKDAPKLAGESGGAMPEQLPMLKAADKGELSDGCVQILQYLQRDYAAIRRELNEKGRLLQQVSADIAEMRAYLIREGTM